MDDTSVNFRGYAMPKGVDQAIVDKAAGIVVKMFNDEEVLRRMKDSYSPMLILDRAKVQAMFKDKQAKLQELLQELNKK